MDKTKNLWEERDDFEKVPGKYDMLHMDYSDEPESVKEEGSDEADGIKKEKKPVNLA